MANETKKTENEGGADPFDNSVSAERELLAG